MDTAILTLRIKGKRDVVVVRQRARQIAGLLGLEGRRRADFAGTAFETACGILNAGGPGAIEFHLHEGCLEMKVISKKNRGQRLDLPLPGNEPSLSRDDVAWVVAALDKLTPLDLFEEMHVQNQ